MLHHSTSLLRRTMHGALKLASDRRGGMAIAYGVAVIPVIGVVALAVDFGRALSVDRDLRSALDAATLAAAGAYSQNRPDDATNVLNTVFADNFKARFVTGVPPVTVSVVGNELRTSVETQLPTTLANVLGFSSLTVGAQAAAAFGVGRAEIALVLDNTGSMAGAKLDGLKAAARDLVDALHAAPNAAAGLRIGLVPFTDYVNVGTSNRNAPWMSVPADYSTTDSGCWDTYPNAVYTNPHEVTGTCWNDGVSSTCRWTEYDVDWGTPVQQCGSWNNTFSWNGCAGSRTYPLNLRDEVTTLNPVPGVLNTQCPAELTRLTSSASRIRDEITAMTASGNTYIAAGLEWGWRVLSSKAPFADGASESEPVRKIIVLMTDGANTKSPTYPAHDGTDATLANRITADLCREIKLAQISIYTVAFDVSDTTISSLLGDCSSGPPFAYSANTVTELQSAFESIGRQITAVRLSK